MINDLLVHIYSPQGHDIVDVEIDSTNNPTSALLGGCGIFGTTSPKSAPWTNDALAPMRCKFSGVQFSGAVRILAKDNNGAQGTNAQSFVIDTQEPTIDLAPSEALTKTEI